MAKGRIWTEEELAVLRDFYPTAGIAATAARLNRKPGQVSYKAHKLEIKSVSYRPWTPEERRILEQFYNSATPMQMLVGMLSGRSADDIRHQGRALKLTRRGHHTVKKPSKRLARAAASPAKPVPVKPAPKEPAPALVSKPVAKKKTVQPLTVPVTADYIRGLHPNHPERLAYTHGGGIRGWEAYKKSEGRANV